MAEWWQMSAEQMEKDGNAQLARQTAYYNTFYASDEGREVLTDITQICITKVPDSIIPEPVGMLARLELLLEIKARAGTDINTDKAAIDAEANAIIIKAEEEEIEKDKLEID